MWLAKIVIILGIYYINTQWNSLHYMFVIYSPYMVCSMWKLTSQWWSNMFEIIASVYVIWKYSGKWKVHCHENIYHHWDVNYVQWNDNVFFKKGRVQKGPKYISLESLPTFSRALKIQRFQAWWHTPRTSHIHTITIWQWHAMTLPGPAPQHSQASSHCTQSLGRTLQANPWYIFRSIVGLNNLWIWYI